jgi:transposase
MNTKPKPPEVLELDAPTVAQIQQRIAARQLEEPDYEVFAATLANHWYLLNLLTQKKISIGRLKKLLFGARTETTEAVLGSAGDGAPAPPAAEGERNPASSPAAASDAPPKRRKGHGRNGAAAYRGAERIPVPHESLAAGDSCPECQDGTLYAMTRPATLIRIAAQAPVQADIYELQRLRCNLCGAVFTAQVPEGLGSQKYDVTVASMKYGTGMPFHRFGRLQENVGIPLPPGTQWGLVCDAAEVLDPALQELVR